MTEVIEPKAGDTPHGMLTLEELRAEVESGAIDTILTCFTDMQGRLMGKRLDAEFFLAENEAGHSGEGCNYLLALEMEMDPVPGYAIASWERGYGDFGLRADLSTLRRIPWHEATVMVQCDVEWHDGTPVDRENRLRPAVGERAQPRPLPPGEDQCLHVVAGSRSQITVRSPRRQNRRR